MLQRADAKFCRRAGASSALFSARVHALQCQRPSRMAQHSARIPRVRDQRSSLQRVGTSGAILGRAHGDGHPALRPTRRACEPQKRARAPGRCAWHGEGGRAACDFSERGPGGAPARQGPANVRAPAGGKSATEAHARGSRAVRACAQSAPAWRSHSAQSARRASAKPRAGQQVRRGDRGRSGAHRPEHGHAPRPPLTMQSSRSARPARAARLHGSPSGSTAPSLGGRKPSSPGRALESFGRGKIPANPPVISYEHPASGDH